MACRTRSAEAGDVEAGAGADGEVRSLLLLLRLRHEGTAWLCGIACGEKKILFTAS